jgi:hypothetical protein
MKTNKQSGFSLLELLLAATLTVGLMGMIFAISNQNQSAFVTESGVVDMNQNVRTAMEMLTRDIQSGGMGLPVGVGSFPAVYYTQGAAGAPDTLMMLNGDPFAPTADLSSRAAGSAEFFLIPPPDVTISGSGSNQQFSYIGLDGEQELIYNASQPRAYIAYDGEHAMLFDITKDGQTTGNGAGLRIRLQHNPQGYLNPASVFGTPIGDGEPNYDSGQTKIALLDSAVGYKLDTVTNELLRTEDLTNWFPVARGIINFQVEFRVVRRTETNSIEEKVTENPGDGKDKSLPSGELTSRTEIHSIIIRIEAATPDVEPGNKHYRRVVHRFEVSPRNFNLVNNNNVRQGAEVEELQ